MNGRMSKEELEVGYEVKVTWSKQIHLVILCKESMYLLDKVQIHLPLNDGI